MSDRFTKIYDLSSNLYCEGAPVIIRAGALHIDNLSGKVAAQLKMQSISPKAIKTVTVSIFPIDGSGNKIDPPTVFQYLDLSVDRDQEFGQKQLIYLPDKNTRSFEIHVTEVIFSDNSIWSSADGEWAPIQTQEKIFGAFSDFELTKQFQSRYGSSAEFFPSQQIDLVLCTCGAVNRNSESLCHKCGNNLKFILAYDRESLERDKEARLAEEKAKAEAEEAARIAEAEKKALEKQEKLKKAKAVLKKVTLAVACAVVLALAVYGIGWHAIPAIRYNSADKALQVQEYDKAIDTFTILGDYRDSKARALDAIYTKGMALIESGDYSSAADEFERILSHEDSSAKAEYCRNMVKYLSAKQALDDGEYEKAATLFVELGEFEDSLTMVDEANYELAKELTSKNEYEKASALLKPLAEQKYKDSSTLWPDVLYRYAMTCVDSKDYEHAVEAFEEITQYKDSEERLKEASYQYAIELSEKSDWKTAYPLFKKLGEYQDSDSRFHEAYYQYGLQLLSSKSYEAAVQVFKSLDGFQESKDKLNEAKYGYILANRNNRDYTTYVYLRDLKSISYKDAKEIYASLYAWTATIVMNDKENDSNTNKSSISKYSNFYCHIRLSGGPPREGIAISYKMTFPDGGTYSDSWDGYWYAGTTGTCWGYYDTPSRGASGTFRIRVYNKSTGDLLGEASIRIT